MGKRRLYDEKGEIALALGASPAGLPVYRVRRGKIVQIPPEWVGRTWVRGVETWKLWKYAETRHPRKLRRMMKWSQGPGHPRTHDGRVRMPQFSGSPRGKRAGSRSHWRKDYEDEL